MTLLFLRKNYLDAWFPSSATTAILNSRRTDRTACSRACSGPPTARHISIFVSVRAGGHSFPGAPNAGVDCGHEELRRDVRARCLGMGADRMKNSRYVARSTAIAARALGDETMVMSATDSTLFTLNEIASVIWAAADGVTPLDQSAANKICTQYDITPELALTEEDALFAHVATPGFFRC